MRAYRLPIASIALGLFLNLAGPLHIQAKEANRFGLGVLFGEPVGPTAAYTLTDSIALDAVVSYSFTEYFVSHVNIHYHRHRLLASMAEELKEVSPFLGFGGGFRISTKSASSSRSKAGAFLRIPLGAAWYPSTTDLEVYLEVAPGLTVAPKVEALVQGGLGVRYYF